MKRYAGLVILAALIPMAGCGAAKRVGSSVKAIGETQVNTVKGVLYGDSIFTDDGRSHLVGREKY